MRSHAGKTDRPLNSPRGKTAAALPHETKRELLAQIEFYRRRERELLALYDFTFDLNRARGSTELLRTIVHRARGFIGSDICYLTSFDPRRRDFFVSFIEGAVSKDFVNVRIPDNLGSCKPIVENKLSFVTEDYQKEARFIHDARVDAALQAEGIVSMAGVPLLLEDTVLGILYVADRKSRSYQPEEIALLVSLASHSALAMQNAHLFEESQNALRVLKRTTDEVQSAITVHEQLTELVAKGGELDELANRMAAVLSAEIMILDLDYTPAVYAKPDDATGRSLDQLVRKRADSRLISALAESRWNGKSVSIAESKANNIRGVAIIGASQVLGGMLISRQKPMTDSEIRTFERGAIVTGIVLLSRDRLEQSHDQELSYLLTALREGRLEATRSLAVHAKNAGISSEAPLSLMVVEAGITAPAIDSRRVLRGLPILSAIIENRTIVFCETGRVSDIAERLQSIVQNESGVRPSIAVASIDSLNECWAAHDLAVRCLRLADALGRRGSIVQASSLSVFATLFADHTKDQLTAFIDATIGPLLLHDRAKTTQVTDTMRLFLDLGSNVSLVAKKLKIHENTVRQRLETAKRLLGLNSLSERTFEIHAALTLHFLKGEVKGWRHPPNRSDAKAINIPRSA